MTDFYLKFASEEEARSVLYTVTPAVLNEEGEVVTEEQVKPNYVNIDVIGEIYKPTGETTTEGDLEVPVMEKLDGYHVNVRAVGDENTSILQQYSVSPSSPMRVWG